MDFWQKLEFHSVRVALFIMLVIHLVQTIGATVHSYIK